MSRRLAAFVAAITLGATLLSLVVAIGLGVFSSTPSCSPGDLGVEATLSQSDAALWGNISPLELGPTPRYVREFRVGNARYKLILGGSSPPLGTCP